AFLTTTASPRRRPGNESLSCREVESLCDLHHVKSTAVPFRRESLHRCRSLLSCDRQSRTVRRAFPAEIFRRPVRSGICRGCIPDLPNRAQPVRLLFAKKLSDKKF